MPEDAKYYNPGPRQSFFDALRAKVADDDARLARDRERLSALGEDVVAIAIRAVFQVADAMDRLEIKDDPGSSARFPATRRPAGILLKMLQTKEVQAMFGGTVAELRAASEHGPDTLPRLDLMVDRLTREIHLDD